MKKEKMRAVYPWDNHQRRVKNRGIKKIFHNIRRSKYVHIIEGYLNLLNYHFESHLIYK